jgi:hypothetical protein
MGSALSAAFSYIQQHSEGYTDILKQPKLDDMLINLVRLHYFKLIILSAHN